MIRNLSAALAQRGGPVDDEPPVGPMEQFAAAMEDMTEQEREDAKAHVRAAFDAVHNLDPYAGCQIVGGKEDS